MIVTFDTEVAGLTLRGWTKLFDTVPGSFAMPHPELKGVVGLFCAVQDGKIVFIGQATELDNGGLYKRLADFWRDGDSGRKHYGGRLIYENRHGLELRVLIVGDDKTAVGLAKLLRRPLIALLEPAWNAARPKPPKLELVSSHRPTVAEANAMAA